ncbi:MAG: hypothetical protein ACYTHJ_12955 [Planctomycetota bacterium]|jgi:hypothetical protein
MSTGTDLNTDPSGAIPEVHDDASRIREFVRTHFSTRCNIVKVWRPFPDGLWKTLSTSEDNARARRAERGAVAFVLAMAAVLIVGFSGMSVGTESGGMYQGFPVVGSPTLEPTPLSMPLGWYFESWLSFTAVFWTVGPSLLGWALVRLIWIPAVIKRNPARDAALAMARHLGSVYLYVYLMIITGAALMVVMARLAPAPTAFFRWCLWCFLFGESFFVPGVMWIRLVLADRSSEVFGRYRIALLLVYLFLFVVVPIYGMTFELD